MEFAQIVAYVTGFLQNHLMISIAVLAVVVYFFYQSPKESFKILVIVVILVIAVYCISQFGRFTDTGVNEKKEMIDKSKRDLDE